MDVGGLHPRKKEAKILGGRTGEASSDTGEPAELRPLTPLIRFYIYALHGCLCEVVFTATCDWCERGDRRLSGHTSLWALPIYGTAILLIERLHLRLSPHYPLLVRLVLYTLLVYLWEFGTGFLLRLAGACPWDYSAFRFNLMGLVTLEYALPWALACLIAEGHIIKNTLRMHL
ncbi:hypothetical protein AGOR_G00115810 [Albula goreensis]|uniref:Transmembrane protein 229B n=1 Tax=Albula goreensis TaxID=1534307 RepID=A0A8T3DG74_9TELE|nr:hypothetical protein AGOR_G00115810 [Albula goreensis]